MGTRILRLGTGAAALVAFSLAVAACGVSADDNVGSGSGGKSGPVTGLRMMVPNSPGSGYDTTARTAAKSMEDASLARNIEVFNVAGAGGVVGLQRLVNEKGNKSLLMQMGLGVVGSVYTNKSKATLNDTTPIARLIEEAEAIVVPKGSPYNTLQDLVTAWKADPGKVPVGGASAPGGPDHLTPMLLAKAVGVTPKDVNYVSYDGGGELLAGVLGKKVAFAATGVGEVAEQAKAGEVKILAVTSDKPVDHAGRARVQLRSAGSEVRRQGPLRRRPAGAHRPADADARLEGMEGGPGGQRLDRRIPDRGRVRRLPQE